MCDAANAEEAAKKAGSYVVRGTMQVHTLDSVLKRDVKAMKIDVEGFEPLVLRGAKRLLEEHRVWAGLFQLTMASAVQTGALGNPAAMQVCGHAPAGMRSNQRLIRSGLCASDPSVSQRVTLHGFGLGAQPATCYIFSDPGNQGDGITMCDAANAEEAAKKAGSYVVRGTMQVHTLDSVLKRDVKAMKIDVEGFEPLVLRGAKRLLEEHRVW
ncbi:hypothetical protein QJQ45_010238 [Haematococcus lacustris]|nr:hypothetical protein QJQ45_010238 [Haematococcus lacustris]